VLAPGATLFPDALARAGLDTREALYDIIYNGKGRMPGYGQKCAPAGACTFAARLGDDDVDALAAYVLQRAGEGWKD
jgi:cytochrome c6